VEDKAFQDSTFEGLIAWSYMTSKIPLRVQELVRDPRVGYSEEDLVGPLAFQVSEPSMILDSGYPTAGPPPG
jgi:hypothetical protein